MSTIRMTGELNCLSSRKLQDSLESRANSHEDILAFLRGTALATSNITIATTRECFADSAGPDTNTEEALADVADDTHDFSIAFVFKCLADGREHDMEPEVIDLDVALLFELIRPFATVLVLLIFPFWSDMFLEEMVV